MPSYGLNTLRCDTKYPITPRMDKEYVWESFKSVNWVLAYQANTELLSGLIRIELDNHRAVLEVQLCLGKKTRKALLWWKEIMYSKMGIPLKSG